MSVLNQKTIKKEISFKGVGLHSGVISNMIIRPSQPNTGIIFIRTDIKKNNVITPNVFNVCNTSFCTTISNEDGASVSTIEHLMGALYGEGIDNAIIEIDNKEIPIMDGSAKKFVEEIRKVGVTYSSNPIKIIKIEKKIKFQDGEKFISIEPSRINLSIDFEIKYENSFINTQNNIVNIFEDNLDDVYNSRTFCLFNDIENLKKMNLAQGGSLENAIVVDGNKILNKDGLRNEKEFVNHKILDCMGDLYLSGYKVLGKIICSQGGHRMTNQVLRKVLSNKENYSIFELKEKNIPHTYVDRSHLKSIA